MTGSVRRDFVYHIHDGATSFRFQLSGNFSGDGVRSVEQTWLTASSVIGTRALIVDLSSVTRMDEAGRELVETWRAEGATIVVTASAPGDRRKRLSHVAAQLLAPLWGRRFRMPTKYVTVTTGDES